MTEQRTLPQSFRRSIESRFSEEVDLCMLTMTNPLLLEPVRVVWDEKDFVYGGNTFIGFPFDITLLTDDDKPPSAQLAIQNIDPRIGDSIQRLLTPLELKIELLCSYDFDLRVTPRQEIGTADVIYSAESLFLTNVKVDALVVSGDIIGWDYLQRGWPGQRATQELLPGNFR